MMQPKRPYEKPTFIPAGRLPDIGTRILPVPPDYGTGGMAEPLAQNSPKAETDGLPSR